MVREKFPQARGKGKQQTGKRETIYIVPVSKVQEGRLTKDEDLGDNCSPIISNDIEALDVYI